MALPAFGRKTFVFAYPNMHYCLFYFLRRKAEFLSFLFSLTGIRTFGISYSTCLFWWTSFSHFNTWTFLSEIQLSSESLLFLFVSSSSSSPARLPPYFHMHQRTTLKFNKNLNEASIEVGNTKLKGAVSSVSQNMCCWSVALYPV